MRVSSIQRKTKGQQVMIAELLRKFSQENFGDVNYEPVLHGYSETAKPLSLIIKRKRSIWKRPFAKAEMNFLGDLEKFVSSDCKKDYTKAVQSKIASEQKIEKGKSDPVDSHMEIYLNVAEIGRIKLTGYVDLGDLQLGRVGQKYILDPELREILSCAVLDAHKMIPYQDEELFLITSVVYSEKFELVGKRKQEREIEARLEALSHFSKVLKSKVDGKYKKTSSPAGVAQRNVWGPILYNCCPVQYNREEKRLEIMKGEFAGPATRNISNVKKKLYDDDDASSDQEDDSGDDVGNDDGPVPFDVVADYISPDDFADQDMNNIERIENVLKTTKSREQQKALVKKYLGWFENLLADDKMKIILDDCERLTNNDCTFLRSLYVAALPGQDSLDFTKLTKADIHGCAFILKLLDELSDEEWEELGIQGS
ncbi:PREDICTED: uncharacterized protein LOC107355245 isoform X2 [Acropora digitifera]|uniref:uncharacterized protein LOC107355245 isoform X2 n=1 Tax=Acropora digitifera TaxID=70779 RepID=UPI00077AFEC1|nr:PREDICTED: uncharacterized protein LOC107355245 isoform X2 [Acropora digitifera]